MIEFPLKKIFVDVNLANSLRFWSNYPTIDINISLSETLILIVSLLIFFMIKFWSSLEISDITYAAELLLTLFCTISPNKVF